MNVQLWQFWQALLAAAIVGSLCDASARAAEWGCEPLPAEGRATGMRVTIDGEHFADYLVHHGHQPVIWPIHGPDGRAMTRQFPLGERLEGEADDHPHHRSLWFNHGLVNGLDFWLEPRAGGPDNQIVHREFVESQENCGMTVIGQFRDLDDPDRFVWLRGFPDMAQRARARGVLRRRRVGPEAGRRRACCDSQ